MHDQHFKELLRRFFGDFVRIVLPDEAPLLRLERARFIEQESFTDVKEGERRLLDLVAEVETTEGESELLLVHVEIEARARGKAMNRRMWRYAMQLWLRDKKPVVPIVLHLRGGAPDVVATTVDHRFGKWRLASFTYFAFGLSRSEAAKYLDRPEALAPALAALMDRGELSAAEHRLECQRRIFQAEVDDAGRFLLMDTVEMYIQLDEAAREEYERLLAAEQNEEVKIMEMTWSESLRAEGMEKGLAQGVEQGIEKGIEKGRAEGMQMGRLEGMRSVVLGLLERRFGPLPTPTRKKVEEIASADGLSRLAERVLDARSVEDLGL